MRLRRKTLPAAVEPAYRAFLAVLEVLEPAKAGLTDVLPGTRMPGRPLADALAAFDAGLAEAATRMDAWRVRDLEMSWVACRDGLDAARSSVRRIRDDRLEPEGFTGLLGLVEQLLDLLDPFAEAEARFAALKRRGS